MIPLMAQSINDTDEAKQEYKESVREQEQMRLEKVYEQKQLRRQQQVDEMMLRMKMKEKKRNQIIKKKMHTMPAQGFWPKFLWVAFSTTCTNLKLSEIKY